jgi:L-ascorbate metabolism protein UlaG (beta-lactamase superfamily)
MNIKWLGHAAFLITAEDGTRIITDPYETGNGLDYAGIEETADIVTVSHGHHDHNNTAAVKGNPVIIKGTGEAGGIQFRGIAAAHDDSGGSQRGSNTILCFEVDGVKVCHLGDLGHPLSAAQQAGVGEVDVLLIPVGGCFTIDAGTASRVSEQIKPKMVIPMHYKNDKCHFPIAGVDEFLKGKSNVTRPGASEVEIKAGALPAAMQITVLEPAL